MVVASIGGAMVASIDGAMVASIGGAMVVMVSVDIVDAGRRTRREQWVHLVHGMEDEGCSSSVGKVSDGGRRQI